MKTIRCLFPLCLAFLFQNLCFAQKSYIDSATFATSFVIWETEKAAHDNSYEFSLSFGSWTGYTSKTTIKVKDGVIVKRAFKEQFRQKLKFLFRKKRWVERGKSIGKHKDTDLVTMDEIYAYAKNYVGKEEPILSVNSDGDTDEFPLLELKISVFFSTDANGILSTAGYVPSNCHDDCFHGYHVVGFKWL